MGLVDPRVTKQAQVLVTHSVKAKKGDKVLITADFEAKPLVLALYKALLTAGAAEIRLHLGTYEFTEAFFKYASTDQVKHFPEISMEEMKKIDCYIGIRALGNTRGLSAFDPGVVAERAKVLRPISDWRVENTRWVITNFPTEALAQEGDMSLADYEDFVFGAINNVDWKVKFAEQEKLRKLVDKTRVVRIVAEGTDLVLNITGRKAVNAGGEYNMPDGEVFTSVVEDSAEGHISYSYPAIYMSREFHKVMLEFKKGKVIKASASKGEEALNKILDMDKGARFIGELGIGNNFKIGRFTKDILFDEKIGGSIHIALGKGYKETKSKNESALHWDMICDLRSGRPRDASASQGGELWFDNKLMQKNGRWLV